MELSKKLLVLPLIYILGAILKQVSKFTYVIDGTYNRTGEPVTSQNQSKW